MVGWLCFHQVLIPKLNEINILGCRNLESFTVSEQHDLVTLRIDIRNCPSLVSFPKGGIRAPDLTFFRVGSCRSQRSLLENMHVLLPSLKSFRVIDCPEVELLPDVSLPSNPEEIHVVNCEKLFAGRMGWGLQNESVRYLTIIDKSENVVSFPEPGLLPSGLTSLQICGFPNMKSLDKKGFQHLTSLQQLSLRGCPKLKYMPEEGLPSSLSSIRINKCPLLKKQWQSKKRKDRRKIPDVDHILIDDEYIG